VVGGLISGLGAFLLARRIEGGEGRVLIDEATGQRIVIRPRAGSLFFIPTRYWAYVMPVLAIAVAARVMTTPPVDPQPASVAVAATPAGAD
jgi:hypothetical protein